MQAIQKERQDTVSITELDFANLDAKADLPQA